MTRRSTTFAMALLATTSVATASDLAPGNGHSIHLGRFDGAVYYTVEKDGYRVVATVASGAEAQPIRFVSTLGPGQRLMISVPQAVGQPSADFEITRDGDVLSVREPGAAPIDSIATSAVVEE
ncbi:hypothetical protein QN219_33310 [Sinorhizobium sp. 7-81]|uniref:hypothetical protein n=1 Tax=Sinorhizobium sp. 8-89 TaxID=3049089 RepID=UPI0024C2CC75|nr:hypothetical protein [Sinorhizobium sp. 8-89]MDK1494785.1 hypothetical protein [Sinorhizobium sp. 8-89]